MRHKTLRLNSVQIAYLEDGDASGIPILFLHGFPDDPTTWDAVVEELPPEDFRLIRPWQRGFGESLVLDESVRGAQVAALAQDVLDLTKGLALDRFFLVGHDWGSRAAHAAAVLAPERVLGMLALSTPYGHAFVNDETELRQE